ncbi:hypothetical protein [Paraferrimonas haliotis]|uniref:Uncharacterized protein n=1 Tax=Paraferrimonas haliotis TaxID=2013866 RepID=A0AA37WXT6_9GAMM|nr:hypothetical protein [Paraferrimonas haliotis]GLS82985.1 hypothetical protein GCM10007894_09620 [Paraferrimonas haliotis]
MKFVTAIVVIIGATLSTSAMANMPTNMQTSTTKPDKPMFIALMADYYAAEQKMYGLTIAPHHYDWDYPNWGYYLGYAQSKQNKWQDDGVNFKRQDRMWRFGLSYSITAGLSVYGGAAYLQDITQEQSQIMPMMEGAEPQWFKSTDVKWGAETGLKYAFSQGWVIALGYNSATESTLLSIGIH